MEYLEADQLEELAQFATPTVSNAIESFNVRRDTEGYMRPSVKSILQYEKPIVGYAQTAKISAAEPPEDQEKKQELTTQYLTNLYESPAPTISVIEDTDGEPIGSFWGDVNASIHLALGCKGVVTNGGVRDLDDVKELGFRFFAQEVLVSHAYVHIVDVDSPVEVGGLEVRPGDLLHADKHGVLAVPHEIAPELPEACREVEEAEDIVIDECKKKIGKEKIEIDRLQALRQKMYEHRDQVRG